MPVQFPPMSPNAFLKYNWKEESNNVEARIIAFKKMFFREFKLNVNKLYKFGCQRCQIKCIRLTLK